MRPSLLVLLYVAYASLRTDLTIQNIIDPRHEKTNVLVSDLVIQKPGCTATEDG